MDKEQIGQKTHIKIQAQKLIKIKPESMANLPTYWRKMSDGYSKKFTHVIKVDVKDINTKQGLIWTIRKHYGMGWFNILFYNRLCKSSNYNPAFRCLVQRKRDCKYKDDGRCTIWQRHKKGWTCKANRRFRPNWNCRASVIIVPNDMFSDIDYKFKWIKAKDKMRYFSKWFWKDTR